MSLARQATVPPRRRPLVSRLTPLTRRRLANFRANRRGFWSLWLFLAIFVISLFAELIANDQPILIRYDGAFYMPIFTAYPETAFGGEFPTEADYRDATVQELIHKKGWMIWPLIPFGARTINYDLPVPAPAPPSSVDWLGTDDQGRDVLARLIYGVRISILFGLTLTVFSSLIGVAAGAVQGYFGGAIDLLMQRFMELWSNLPQLYMLIILGSIVQPNFWWLLGLMLLFEWMSLVYVVRAEFLRARNFDYVRAARALGVSDPVIMVRHVLPNAMVSTLTFLPFIMSGSIATLTALDFLGFGLPPGSASVGELVGQAKGNLQAPWLGITAFVTIATSKGPQQQRIGQTWYRSPSIVPNMPRGWRASAAKWRAATSASWSSPISPTSITSPAMTAGRSIRRKWSWCPSRTRSRSGSAARWMRRAGG